MQNKHQSDQVKTAVAPARQAQGMASPASVLLVLLLIAALLFSGFASQSVGAASVAVEAALPAQAGIGATPQVSVLTADDRALTVAFAFDESHLRLEDAKQTDASGQLCQQVELMGGVRMDGAGLPDLPLFSKLVGLPADGRVSLSVTSLDSVTLPGSYHICPGLERDTVADAEGAPRYQETKVTPDSSVYGQNQAYPAQIGHFADLGFMRGQRLGRIQLAPVQVNPVTGALTLHRRILVTLTFDGVGSWGRSSQTGQSFPESDAFESTFASTLLNYEQAQGWRAEPKTLAALSSASTSNGSMAASAAAIWKVPSPAYRVAVNQTGIHKLTHADLVGAGVPVDTLDPRTLKLYLMGSQVAINVTGQADGKFDTGDLLIFYGQAINTRYTDTNIYWLTYGGAAGLRMATATTGGNGTAVTRYTETARFERNFNYVSTLPKLEGFDHWYDVAISAFTTNAGLFIPGNTTYALATNDLAQGTFTATLNVAVAGNNFGKHHLYLLVNGQPVGDFTWDNRTYAEFVAQVPQSQLVAGNNSVTVRNSTDLSGLSVDTVYVDWVSLTYQRQLKAQSNRLAFADAGAGSWSYNIGGFSGSDVAVYDVTAPGQVAAVPVSVNGGTVSFSRTNATARRYLALEAGQMLAPKSIAGVSSTSLAGSGVGGDTGADYIIITHPDFLTAIAPLADYRAQSMRVRTVNVMDIYDQFGYGLPSAEAIRDFLGYAYANWPGTPPSYVLLVGDGTYDMRKYISRTETYIPPFLAMVDPDLGETAAENRFVMLTGDDLLADMFIGRFPANSAADVQVMVQKTITYETAPPSGAWQKRALFVTDDLSDGGGAFYAFSDEIADGTVDDSADSPMLLPAEYERIKVYMGPSARSSEYTGSTCALENPSNECRNRIAQAINEGVSIVSYVGHGTKQEWAAEKLYDQDLVSSLSNGDKLPVILAMTCQEGYFQLPTLSALAESSVRVSGKGAVASWSPTGFGLATGHDLLEKGFMLAVFHEGTPQLGVAAQRGKLNLYEKAPANRYDDLLDTFMLFGDPALRMLGGKQGSDIFLPMLNR